MGKPVSYDEISAPENLPEMGREDFAHALINGGYPELQTKSARAKPIWLNSYLQGRLNALEIKVLLNLQTLLGQHLKQVLFCTRVLQCCHLG
ncbi:hypothetical protein [Leucothrix arctica]|uniref:Uncharacterized protein n=1 Tax=Leucothrix arctica TaxID=1481894 RepID=A0A317CGW9_9GAMM|nr:hypothetical protein [Leucothrix arctica]PWQ97599.1 hypothetical protein DKT75_06685 [Leucothrix arctica]